MLKYRMLVEIRMRMGYPTPIKMTVTMKSMSKSLKDLIAVEKKLVELASMITATKMSIDHHLALIVR